MIEHLFDISQCGYTPGMTVATTLGIRELRDGLSRHIAAVREGEEIIVTDHGKPVARITPYRASRTEEVLNELTAQGLATPPRTKERWIPNPIKLEDETFSLSELLIEMRK